MDSANSTTKTAAATITTKRAKIKTIHNISIVDIQSIHWIQEVSIFYNIDYGYHGNDDDDDDDGDAEDSVQCLK